MPTIRKGQMLTVQVHLDGKVLGAAGAVIRHGRSDVVVADSFQVRSHRKEPVSNTAGRDDRVMLNIVMKNDTFVSIIPSAVKRHIGWG